MDDIVNKEVLETERNANLHSENVAYYKDCILKFQNYKTDSNYFLVLQFVNFFFESVEKKDFRKTIEDIENYQIRRMLFIPKGISIIKKIVSNITEKEYSEEEILKLNGILSPFLDEFSEKIMKEDSKKDFHENLIDLQEKIFYLEDVPINIKIAYIIPTLLFQFVEKNTVKESMIILLDLCASFPRSLLRFRMFEIISDRFKNNKELILTSLRYKLTISVYLLAAKNFYILKNKNFARFPKIKYEDKTLGFFDKKSNFKTKLFFICENCDFLNKINSNVVYKFFEKELKKCENCGTNIKIVDIVKDSENKDLLKDTENIKKGFILNITDALLLKMEKLSLKKKFLENNEYFLDVSYHKLEKMIIELKSYIDEYYLNIDNSNNNQKEQWLFKKLYEECVNHFLYIVFSEKLVNDTVKDTKFRFNEGEQFKDNFRFFDVEPKNLFSMTYDRIMIVPDSSIKQNLEQLGKINHKTTSLQFDYCLNLVINNKLDLEILKYIYFLTSNPQAFDFTTKLDILIKKMMKISLKNLNDEKIKSWKDLILAMKSKKNYKIFSKILKSNEEIESLFEYLKEQKELNSDAGFKEVEKLVSNLSLENLKHESSTIEFSSDSTINNSSTTINENKGDYIISEDVLENISKKNEKSKKSLNEKFYILLKNKKFTFTFPYLVMLYQVYILRKLSKKDTDRTFTDNLHVLEYFPDEIKSEIIINLLKNFENFKMDWRYRKIVYNLIISHKCHLSKQLIEDLLKKEKAYENRILLKQILTLETDKKN